MRDVSRAARKLRRKVYRQTPVATWNRIAELDHRQSYAEMTAVLDRTNFGIRSAGAALILWRAYADRGLDAWCYEFGLPETLTHTVTIVEIDGVLEIHDGFFNWGYRSGLYDMLASLRNGNAVTGKREPRDRKIYTMDPAGEPPANVRWLEAHADREIEPAGELRRFELLWNPEAYAALEPAVARMLRELAMRGFPGDLQFMMLHPVAVFDGTEWHRDRADMPLLRGQELRSPAAALRMAARELEAERAQTAEKTSAITRLQSDLAQANARLTAGREDWLQQKVAWQADKNALEGELRETRARLAAAVDLRAQRDSQIAQLRAEIEDAARQNRELEARLSADAALWQSRANSADEHAIEVSHYLAPLLDEISHSRTEREAMAREIAKLEAKIAGSFAARFAALWYRIIRKEKRP